MKVLLLRANPRKAGFTQRLTDLFARGLQESGAEVEDVSLVDRQIAPCDGCYHCWLATPGECVHHDDATELLTQVLAADVLVFVTPVYYYAMAGCLKIFIERLFPLFKPGTVLSARGQVRNGIRHPDRWKGKKLVTIVTGAMRGPELFRPVNETFQLIADGMDLELGGQVTRPETYLLSFPDSKPRTLKLVEAAFVQAGRETGRNGVLAPETMAAAALPLASDLESFMNYSHIYWERAGELGPDGMSLQNVEGQVTGDPRIILREMVRYHDPAATAGVKARIRFDFPDRACAYTVAIDRGQCRLVSSEPDNEGREPDLTVRCASNTWAELLARRLDFREALARGDLALAGDKTLFSRLRRFFPTEAR